MRIKKWHDRNCFSIMSFLIFTLVFCFQKPLLVNDFNFIFKSDMKSYRTGSLLYIFNDTFSICRMIDFVTVLVVDDSVLLFLVFLFSAIIVTKWNALIMNWAFKYLFIISWHQCFTGFIVWRRSVSESLFVNVACVRVICVNSFCYLFIYIFKNVTVFTKVVWFLILCNSSIFNCSNRAVADTCHTVSTCIAPHRSLIC